MLTSAPFEDPVDGWQVLHFAVPMDAEGVSLQDDWHTLGMRATGSQTIVLDEVFVPEGAVFLRRHRGEFHDVWNVVITVALPLVMGVYVGIAERAAETALPFAARNALDPAVQWAAGEMRSALVIARTLHDHMVAMVNDLDVRPSLDLSDEMLILKTKVVEATQCTVERAVEVAGGAAFYRRNGLERLLRDVRAGQFPPTPREAATGVHRPPRPGPHPRPRLVGPHTRARTRRRLYSGIGQSPETGGGPSPQAASLAGRSQQAPAPTGIALVRSRSGVLMRARILRPGRETGNPLQPLRLSGFWRPRSDSNRRSPP